MFKCRASGAGAIMTDPRSKSETLSETCKDYLRCQWIAETYNREKEIVTPAIQKGLLNEEIAITMLSEFTGVYYEKNDKRKENLFITGTADLIAEDAVIDLKNSFDIFTFAKAGITKDYEYQLLCYMELWGLKKASLVYVLTDTPDSLIHAETKSVLWKLQDDSLYDEIYQAIKKNRTYSDIPASERIKVFPVQYDPEKIESLYTRVKLCRNYYDSLSLTGTGQLVETL